jgi:alcohol-forming fatty acyl-CoA reductase
MKFPNNPMHMMQTFDEVYEELTAQHSPLNAPRIPEFYAGQEIFITGGSGFIGKALIEKLLRSCPELKTIYILMRPKKGKGVEERLVDILKNPAYDILRRLNTNFHEKIVPIIGDVAQLKLGMSDDDIQRTKNVSIIFHSAASVRFDDSLKYAVLMNTRGTQQVMEFALNLTNVKSVVHVSTTYSNVYVHTLEEKLYPPAADWRKTIEMCEKLDEDELEILTQHYISFMPNTYVFSKNLAEHVSDSYKDRLPIVLFRPSVVISAMQEPLPGKLFLVNCRFVAN